MPPNPSLNHRTRYEQISCVHINPDHFLQTEHERVVTAESNAQAWLRCHEDLKISLERASRDSMLYVLVGAQGSGKSTWAAARKTQEPAAVIFDAILVKRSEREPLLEQAKSYGVPAVAVWFRTSLDTCLARNSRRPSDEKVNEVGLRNVFAALEPPSLSEGFSRVVEVRSE